MALGLMLIYQSAEITGGRFVYFMDDAYIHMGVAKNWLLNGSIGINEKGWTSLTSSPLYTFLLIALLKVTNFSDQILWPLGLGVWVFFTLTMGTAFRRYGYSLRTYQVYILSVALCIPLTYSFLGGMEHIIHVWFTSMLLVHWHGSVLGSETQAKKATSGSFALIAAYSALAILTRFETIFLVGLLGAIDLFEGKYRRVLLLAVATVIPPIVFMAWMHWHGADFVPGSVAVKSTLDTSSVRGFVHTVGMRIWRDIAAIDRFWLFATALSVLAPAGISFLRTRDPNLRPLLVASICILAGMVLTPMDSTIRYEMWLFSTVLLAGAVLATQLTLLQVGWICIASVPLLISKYLYDHYQHNTVFMIMALIAVMIYVPALQLFSKGGIKALLVPLATMAIMASYNRTIKPLPYVRLLGGNVYGQQKTFALFLKRYYDGQPIVLNDIGTTAFYTSCPIIDRAGLATKAMVPAVKRYNQGFKAGFARSLDSVAQLRNARLAILYKVWMPEIPPRWIAVGSIRNEPVLGLLGDPLVTFYAFDPKEALLAKEYLRSFASSIPPHTELKIEP